MTVTATETIRKEIFVDAAPETAFRVFTEQVSAWWPLDKYGIYLEEAETVAFEDRDGWRLIEQAKDGRENVWGEVLEYEVASRVRCRPSSRRCCAGRSWTRFVSSRPG